MSKNYLTILLDDKIYSQRTENSKFVSMDFNGNEIDKYNTVPSEIEEILKRFKDIEENPKKYFNYKILANNTVEIVKVYGAPFTMKHHKIPDFIENHPVTTIGPHAIAPSLGLNLEQIELPDTIKEIKPHAFYGCKKLKVFYVPENVTKIPRECFLKCNSLKSIYLNNVKEIKENAFEDCYELRKIDLRNVEKISEYAFIHCEKLKNIVFSKYLDKIPYGCFWGCNELSEIHIPQNITTIHSNAFNSCKQLKNVFMYDTTAYRQEAFQKDANILYNKNINIEER